jgi:hypothetical protein
LQYEEWSSAMVAVASAFRSREQYSGERFYSGVPITVKYANHC